MNLLIALAILTSLFHYAASHVQGDHSEPKPNILLVVADSLGYNDIGYNAQKYDSAMRTPHLDRLASAEVTLANYYVQPSSTPSRSQLMTGRYQIHTGLQHHAIEPARPICIPDDETTLAQKMQTAGYATHMIGKWHLGFYKEECLPTHKGFDSFLGFYLGTEDYYHHNRTWTETSGKGFTAAGYDFHKDTPKSSSPAGEYDGQYSTYVFTKETQNILKQHKSTDKPMFLYLAFQAAHQPLAVDREYERQFKKLKGHKRRRTMAGVIKCMDEAIGNITSTLRETNLINNTVIIFTTDGGANTVVGNNWPLRGTRQTLWEGAVHGVGFVNSRLLPTEVQGTTSNAFIHVSDWFPTIVKSLAGGDLSGGKPLDGYDVWDAITKGTASPRTELLHNIDPLHSTPSQEISSEFNTSIQAALRKGDWKIITGNPAKENIEPNDSAWIPPVESNLQPIMPKDPKGKDTWLFNITADPNEKTDLSDKNPDVVKEMLGYLQDYYQTMVDPIWPDPDPNCDPEKRKGVWGPWK
ncbi:arylsulfatase B-like [Amphiura filiformis]|uniref:arylsulfatase B-like n=1 Tax=Amphiura filiformis TaxID=82378 RepID=UPI003B221B3B